MKRLIIIALAIVCGVAFSESFAKKPKKASSEKAEQLEENRPLRHTDSLRRAELEALKKEMERRDSIRKELDEIEALLEQQKPRERGSLPLYEEMEVLELPCQEAAKSTDEYYAAWAVSDGQQSQNFAIQDAMRKAQLELAKQVGGENVEIDAEIVCRKVSLDRFGNYIAYVAIRMKKNK